MERRSACSIGTTTLLHSNETYKRTQRKIKIRTIRPRFLMSPIALVVCVRSFGLVFLCLFTSTDHKVSHPPEKVVMEANEEVCKLEAAVAAWRQENCSRKTFARCSEDGPEPSPKSPLEVHRTGHRAKGSVPPRGREGRRTFEAAQVRSSSASSIFGTLWWPIHSVKIDALILERDSLWRMHKTMPGVWCGDGSQSQSNPAHAHFGSSRS